MASAPSAAPTHGVAAPPSAPGQVRDGESDGAASRRPAGEVPILPDERPAGDGGLAQALDALDLAAAEVYAAIEASSLPFGVPGKGCATWMVRDIVKWCHDVPWNRDEAQKNRSRHERLKMLLCRELSAELSARFKSAWQQVLAVRLG